MVRAEEIKNFEQTLKDYNDEPNAVRIYLDKDTKEIWYHAFADLDNNNMVYDDSNIVVVSSRNDLSSWSNLNKNHLLELIDDKLNE